MQTVTSFILGFWLFFGGTPTAPAVNSKAISFELKDTKGETISLNNFKDSKGIILTFISNDCPISQRYQSRIIDLQKKYGALGFPVVAIDPADSMGDMKKVASEKGFNFYYLQDTNQKVSWAYGAIVNTHTVILTKEKDGFKISYIGAIDDNSKLESVSNKYVETAITSILAKEPIKTTKTAAKGCTFYYQ